MRGQDREYLKPKRMEMMTYNQTKKRWNSKEPPMELEQVKSPCRRNSRGFPTGLKGKGKSPTTRRKTVGSSANARNPRQDKKSVYIV